MRKSLLACSVLMAVSLGGPAYAATTKGVWWWRGEDVASSEIAAKRLDFLAQHGVGEIYFCVDLRKYNKETRAFVKAAGAKGIRVALLAGDVSWIRPGNRGFAETLIAYRSYQRHAAPSTSLRGSAQYFCRVFKADTGLTAESWRAQNNACR